MIEFNYRAQLKKIRLIKKFGQSNEIERSISELLIRKLNKLSQQVSQEKFAFPTSPCVILMSSLGISTYRTDVNCSWDGPIRGMRIIRNKRQLSFLSDFLQSVVTK